MGVSIDSLQKMSKGFDIRVDSLLRFGGTEIRMDGVFHMGFSDLARWSPPLGRRFQFVYTDNPERAHFAIASYTLAFFSKYLKNTAKEYLSVEIPPGVQIKIEYLSSEQGTRLQVLYFSERHRGSWSKGRVIGGLTIRRTGESNDEGEKWGFRRMGCIPLDPDAPSYAQSAAKAIAQWP